VRKLVALELADHTPYHGVRLTERGRAVALEVIRHHRLLEVYLTQALGLTWDEVHAEAEKLEHHLSDTVEARIDELCGYPTHDPHGDPIPSSELVLAEDDDRPLDALRSGDGAIVRRVPDGDPSLLRYLAELGVVPDRPIVVVERAPFDGPVTIEVDGQRHAIGVSLARRILVTGAA